MIRILLTTIALMMLTGCSEVEICKGCCGHPERLPPIEERVAKADVIILGTFNSVRPTGIRRANRPEYKMGFAYTFDVVEYVKGAGDPQVEFVASYCDEAHFRSLPTVKEATELVRPMLAKRETRFDLFEKVVFLYNLSDGSYYGRQWLLCGRPVLARRHRV